MNPLNYSITAVIVFLGLVIGMIIASMAKEELKARKYFILAQSFALSLILFFVLAYYYKNIYAVLLITLIVLVVLIKHEAFHKKSHFIYPLLAFVFYFSSKNNNLFVINSSLIFFYGFLVSALNIDFKKKNYLRLLSRHSSFIIIALALLLL